MLSNDIIGQWSVRILRPDGSWALTHKAPILGQSAVAAPVRISFAECQRCSPARTSGGEEGGRGGGGSGGGMTRFGNFSDSRARGNGVATLEMPSPKGDCGAFNTAEALGPAAASIDGNVPFFWWRIKMKWEFRRLAHKYM